MILTGLARPKVNLFLHVTERREDGYHLLESLVCFPDGIGDRITVSEGDALSLFETGPFASQTGCQSQNLIMKAADLLKREFSVGQGAKVLLEKNLPVASGIGGGSADAALTLNLLCDLWKISIEKDHLESLAASLGADVPSCLQSRTAMMRGIGEILSPVETLPAFSILLVNPGVTVSTPAIFKELSIPEDQPAIPERWGEVPNDIFLSLGRCRNDLEPAAFSLVPAIKKVINILKMQDGCRLARMSGSGATCFGLFETLEEARDAQKTVEMQHPSWWSAASMVNADVDA